ncbi:MAG: hypothetical protein AAFW89_12505 [Bacteroidota bacterium]
MKTLKSLFAITAIVTLSFGCASVTSADLDQPEMETPEIEAPEAVFEGDGGMKPIIERPKL